MLRVSKGESHVPDSGKREKAKDYLAKIIFEDIRDEYSSSEMQSLVIPLIELRLNEYHGILDGSGEPSDKISRLGSLMVDNFIDDVRLLFQHFSL